MSRDFTRRKFLGNLAAGGAAAANLPWLTNLATAAEGKLPHRTLGHTGASVSILAFGCGSRFLQFPADQATAVIERAVGLGISYLDTAADYGKGESETRLGRFLAARRRAGRGCRAQDAEDHAENGARPGCAENPHGV